MLGDAQRCTEGRRAPWKPSLSCWGVLPWTPCPLIVGDLVEFRGHLLVTPGDFVAVRPEQAGGPVRQEVPFSDPWDPPGVQPVLGDGQQGCLGPPGAA